MTCRFCPDPTSNDLVSPSSLRSLGGITNILDILAPVKTIQVRSNYVPGLSSETKSLQRERNLAQQKASVTNEAEDWRIFRSLRNRTTASIRKDKKEWEEKKFQCEENSSSDMWRTVKGWLGWQTGGPPTQLYHDGSLISTPAGLSSTMNEFFISKVNNLRKKIPSVDSDPLRYLKDAMSDRSCFFQITTSRACPS